MTYESETFKEHHLTKLPVLDALLKIGWERVIFMQTNREDLGDRYRLIEIPYTKDRDAAKEVSRAYREYFEGLDELTKCFASLSNDL